MPTPHVPVLCNEFLSFFEKQKLKIFIDGTLGAGGHAEAILKAHSELEYFIGLDQDPQARALAEHRLVIFKDKVKIIASNFADIPKCLKSLNIDKIDGLFLDLGVSSMQLDQGERGFSFMKDGPLDMRMNSDQSVTAADIVNKWEERELIRIIFAYGEEPKARSMARAIVNARQSKSLKTTQELVDIIMPLFPAFRKKSIHPMTLLFQALRIAVNNELQVLETLIPEAIKLLNKGGRLGIISYHSLEDRIVKNLFRFYASDKYDTSGIEGVFLDKIPEVKLLTRKPIEASLREIESNPRSRSAKMRFIEKC